jgi:hypothetical protein
VPTESIHKQTLDIYRKNILYPLFRILTSEQLLEELRQQGASSTLYSFFLFISSILALISFSNPRPVGR